MNSYHFNEFNFSRKLEELRKQREEQRLRNLERIRIENEIKIERFQQLENSQNTFSSIASKIREHYCDVHKIDEWNKYMLCEKYPDMSSPSSIREFLTQIATNLQSHDGEYHNWWLKCDERSLLTQVSEIPDTRRCKIKKIRESTMNFYNGLLQKLFIVNDRLNQIVRKKSPQKQLNELITVSRTTIFFIEFLNKLVLTNRSETMNYEF